MTTWPAGRARLTGEGGPGPGDAAGGTAAAGADQTGGIRAASGVAPRPRGQPRRVRTRPGGSGPPWGGAAAGGQPRRVRTGPGGSRPRGAGVGAACLPGSARPRQARGVLGSPVRGPGHRFGSGALRAGAVRPVSLDLLDLAPAQRGRPDRLVGRTPPGATLRVEVRSDTAVADPSAGRRARPRAPHLTALAVAVPIPVSAADAPATSIALRVNVPVVPALYRHQSVRSPDPAVSRCVTGIDAPRRDLGFRMRRSSLLTSNPSHTDPLAATICPDYVGSSAMRLCRCRRHFESVHSERWRPVREYSAIQAQSSSGNVARSINVAEAD